MSGSLTRAIPIGNNSFRWRNRRKIHWILRSQVNSTQYGKTKRLVTALSPARTRPRGSSNRDGQGRSNHNEDTGAACVNPPANHPQNKWITQWIEPIEKRQCRITCARRLACLHFKHHHHKNNRLRLKHRAVAGVEF